MAILSKQQIFDAEDVTEKTIPVEEWGGDVLVRSISHNEMRKIKAGLSDDEGNVDEDEIEKRIFLSGCIEPEFTSEEYDTYILNKSTAAVMKVLNGIMGSSKATKDAVKEQEKSFREGPE